MGCARVACLVVATIAATACGSPPSVRSSDLVGVWNGDYGPLVFREVDGELHATYDYFEGTVVAEVTRDKVVGWWCQAPNRRAPKSAGEVEFTVLFDGNGDPFALDGRWRFGDSGPFADDWDVARTDVPPPIALAERFDDGAAFCSRP